MYSKNYKVILVFTALTIASVLFFGSSFRGIEFRRSCVGEVWSEATGTGPDVKPAPQWNGLPGESKVKLSWDWGIWRHLELSDHHITFFKGFKLIVSSCTNSTDEFNLYWNTNYRMTSLSKLELIINSLVLVFFSFCFAAICWNLNRLCFRHFFGIILSCWSFLTREQNNGRIAFVLCN